jgi:hypothetical protein
MFSLFRRNSPLIGRISSVLEESGKMINSVDKGVKFYYNLLVKEWSMPIFQWLRNSFWSSKGTPKK